MASLDERSDNELLKAIAMQVDKAMQAQLGLSTFSGTKNQCATDLTLESLRESMQAFAQLPQVPTWEEIAGEIGLDIEAGDMLFLSKDLEDGMIGDYDKAPAWLKFSALPNDGHGYVCRGDILKSFLGPIERDRTSGEVSNAMRQSAFEKAAKIYGT